MIELSVAEITERLKGQLKGTNADSKLPLFPLTVVRFAQVNFLLPSKGKTSTVMILLRKPLGAGHRALFTHGMWWIYPFGRTVFSFKSRILHVHLNTWAAMPEKNGEGS